MSRPRIFISYSRQNIRELGQVRKHLAALEGVGVEIWSDERINAGQDWRAETESALENATVALLLVTPDYLTSKFITQTEVPALLQARTSRGLKIFPLIALPCAWESVEWLATLQVLPRDAKPIWGSKRRAEERLADITRELGQLLITNPEPSSPPVPVSPLSVLPTPWNAVEALYSRRTFIARRGVSSAQPRSDPPPARDDIVLILSEAHDRPALTTVLVSGRQFDFEPISLVSVEVLAVHATYWRSVFQSTDAYVHLRRDVIEELWRVVALKNAGLVDSVLEFLLPTAQPTLKSILNDPRWKLRTRHSAAIMHAVAVASLHDRALDDVLLFAAFLAQADQHMKGDTALFTLETLTRQAGLDVVPTGMDESIPSLLKLDARGITTFRISSTEPLSAALEQASADDAALVLHVIEEAEAIRTKTGKEDHLDNRHLIAALLARPHRSAVGPYLDEQQFDLASLRRDLLTFIVEQHGESADQWRTALFVTSPFDVANRIASDVWTYDDSLGYRVYAKAIADAILKGSTMPPLTIGIQAPWGHGKTSLMRMIQLYLDPQSRQRNDDPPRAAGLESKYRDFLRLLGTPDLLLRAKAWIAKKLNRIAESITVPERDEGLIPTGPDTIPTVWFNPLYYRERKQIWAGLAHAILHQLAQQLPSQRLREEFWLRLQFARIDVHAVRRDVQRFVLLRVAPVIAFWLASGIAFAFSLAMAPVAVIGVIGALLHGFIKANKVLRDQTVSSSFAKYVTEPNYAGELGLLHLVDHDLDLALRLLVGKRKIAVFIDDLDRCDPATVNEIVLAINHFLSVQNRRAFFFLGMDMAMVADALEQVHAKGREGSTGRGFGWRFMEKFVQLPFVIPHLDPETAKAFAMEQLRGTAPVAAPAAPVAENRKVESIEERVKNARTPTDVARIARQAFGTPRTASDRARLEETFSSRTTELMADPDSDEIESIAKLAVEDLELNPRTIKRYFCLVRVLRNIQIATGTAQSPDNDRKAILRAAHLLMNWPEFGQWLRDHESFADIQDAATGAASHAEYDQALRKLFGENTPSCITDASLYRFLNKIGKEGPSLSDLYAARLL